MKNFLLLFKKDLAYFVSSYKQDRKRWDIMNILSSVVLLCIIYGVFIYVFHGFAELYLNTNFGTPDASKERAYELLTYVFTAVILINVFVGVKKIYNSISESEDCEVLIFQPISARTIFFYKLVGVFFSQVISSLLILLPVGISVDTLSVAVGGSGYYFAICFSIVFIPLVSCALAAVFSIPYIAVMRWVDSKFIIHLILYVVIIACGFWLYSIFLSGLTGLLNSGEIQFIFDRNTINTLNSLSKQLFPSNFFVNILFGEKVWVSILIIIALSLGASAITYFVIQAMYSRILQDKMEGNVKVYNNKGDYKKRSVTQTLLRKEFLVVLRTPSYAFQYFATAVTLPFMVYVCVNLMRSMMSTLTVIDCDYELAIFVTSMFCILTNTFCTTNISRDGKMFAMLKTLPVKCADIIRCKMIFCGVVSTFSILASCVTLIAVGYLTIWQAAFVWFVAMMLSIAEIAYATRKDLNSPTFPSSDHDEITESSGKTSTVSLIGLFVSILAGGGALLLSALLGIISTVQNAILASMGFVTVITSIVFALSLIYLFKGLKTKYYSDN